MKSTNYIINGVLAIAVIVLFVLQFSKKETNTKTETGVGPDSVSYHLPVAYIRTDSLVRSYQFYIDVNESLMDKIEKEQVTYNQRMQKIQNAIVEYQKRAQTNAFLSRERQEQEEMRITNQQKELQDFRERFEGELNQETNRLNLRIQDTIQATLKVFNSPLKYQIIFGTQDNGNIFFAEDYYDITKEVVDFLNARYTPFKE